MKNKPSGLISLLHLGDFVECGRVYQCLKNNPNISDAEVAKKTGLLISRVVVLRTCIEYEFGLSKRAEIPSSVSFDLEKQSEIISQSSEGSETYCPVELNMEYIGRITDIKQENVGVTLIEDFPVCIPGAAVGELVKFRIKKIVLDYAEAEIVRLLQESPTVQTFAQEEIEEEDESTLKCSKCLSPITDKEDETQNGLCKRCWLQKIQLETRKADRRSGLYGADRAGTW